jgi:hypothetical protein
MPGPSPGGLALTRYTTGAPPPATAPSADCVHGRMPAGGKKTSTGGYIPSTPSASDTTSATPPQHHLALAREPSALGFGKQSNEINPTLGRVGCGPLTHATSANAAGALSASAIPARTGDPRSRVGAKPALKTGIRFVREFAPLLASSSSERNLNGRARKHKAAETANKLRFWIRSGGCLKAKLAPS